MRTHAHTHSFAQSEHLCLLVTNIWPDSLEKKKKKIVSNESYQLIIIPSFVSILHILQLYFIFIQWMYSNAGFHMYHIFSLLILFLILFLENFRSNHIFSPFRNVLMLLRLWQCACTVFLYPFSFHSVDYQHSTIEKLIHPQFFASSGF